LGGGTLLALRKVGVKGRRNRKEGKRKMPLIILWLLGVPLGLIVVLWLLGVGH
jgi:hypothetical protein